MGKGKTNQSLHMEGEGHSVIRMWGALTIIQFTTLFIEVVVHVWYTIKQCNSKRTRLQVII